jgi:myosin heavy subunit
MMEVTVTRLQRVAGEVEERWLARKAELAQTEAEIQSMEDGLVEGDASVAAAIKNRTRTERQLQQHELTLSRTKDAATDELGQRALLDTQLRQLTKNLTAVHDTIAQRARTKEHKLKALKGAQIREQALNDAVAAEATQLALLATTLQAKRKEAIDFSDILVKLQHEVVSQQRSWETAAGTAQGAVATVQGMSSRGRSLDKELVHEVRKLGDLTRKVRCSIALES